MLKETRTPDEAIFGSPELSEFCGLTSESMHGGFGSTTDNHSDDTNSPPSNLEDPDGADLLNLISTSLDRFNALFHTNKYSGDGSQNRSIPIPSYARPNPADFELSENFSNSVLPAGWMPSEFPRSASPSLVLSNLSGSPLESALSSQHHKGGLPSPPGLPRLASQLPFGLNFDSNNSRSQIDHNAIFKNGFIDRHHRAPPDTCSSLSEASVWDSQFAAVPSEMGMLSVDSGIGSESVFHQSWLSCQTASLDQTSAKPVAMTESPHLEEHLNARSFDFSGCHDNVQSQKILLEDLKAALQSTSGISVVNGNKTVSDSAAAANFMLRSMVWSSWPVPSPMQKNGNRFLDQASSSFDIPQFMRDGHQRSKMSSTSSSSSCSVQHQSRDGCSGGFPGGGGTANRRKAESCSFASLLPVGMRSSSVIGQLGSPPLPPSVCRHELDQAAKPQFQSKPFGNMHKFGRDMQSRMTYFSGKSGPVGLLSTQPSSTNSSSNMMKGLRNGFACHSSNSKGNRKQQQQQQPARAALLYGSSSSSSSIGNDGKPVIAKWRRACSFYLRGHCKKEDCEFAHDLTKVTCKFWELGECFKGSTCPFLHGYPPELLEQQEHNSSAAPPLHEAVAPK